MRHPSLFFIGLVLLSCSGKERGTPVVPQGEPPPAQESPLTLEAPSEDQQGLRFRLSEVERPFDAADRAPLADARALPAARVRELLDRVPEIETAERTSFKLRSGSPPPPRTGTDVLAPWPPPPSPAVAPEVPAGPLQVARFAPQGDVAIAPHLSITFNQPMVPLTSHDQASKIVPVTLDPPVEGAWRWVGTQTLLFEPDPRLPMATSFTATVPAGTASQSGATLDAAHTWTFQTPPVKVRNFWPAGNGMPLQPVVVLTFDQRTDARIADFVALRDGSREVPLRIATDEDLARDEAARLRVEGAEDGRTIALTPVEPLTPATRYRVVLRQGAPSAEGPRLTAVDQAATFQTFYPLKIEDWGCWENGNRCNPAGQLHVRLNNALKPDQDLASLVKVEPEVAQLSVNKWGNSIQIRGRFAAESTVTVTLDPSLTDSFGQRLGRAASNTFRFGPHDPLLTGPGPDHIVLDPLGPPAVSVYSRTHEALDVQIFALDPDAIPQLAAWAMDRRQDQGPPPLRRLERRTVQVARGPAEDLTETAIDLSAHLTDRTGQVFVMVEPTRQPPQAWRRSQLRLWVQRTRLGATVQVDNTTLQAWITDLATGAPVPSAKVRLLGASQGAATTGDDGLAKLAPYATSAGPHALIVERDDELAVLPASMGWWMRHGPWAGSTTVPSLRWFVFDDRGMVKPGETAHIKGIVRPFLGRPGEGLRAFSGRARVTWEARDSRGAEIGKGEVDISELGSFDLDIAIPETPNLGPATVILSTTWDNRREIGRHSFQIQEFRRPEFEVSSAVDPRPYVLGEHAIATATASYYAGGGLPGATARWNVTATPASFRPPGWDRFSFGVWTPWWRMGPSIGGASTSEQLEGLTGPDGSHSVRMDFVSVNPARPSQIRAEVSVEDVNRQRWSSSSSFLVHPSDHYVGIKLGKPFLEQGGTQTIQAIVAGIDGAALAGVAMDVKVARMKWTVKDGVWSEEAVDPQTCALTSADAPVSCDLTFVEGGSYRVTTSIRDDAGRANETIVQFWVSGGKGRPNRSVSREEILLVPSGESFEVGQTAEIFAQVPFAPAELLVTVQQDGLLKTERHTLPDGTGTLRLPIDEAMVPGFTLSVEAVGSAPRLADDGSPLPDAPRRPAFAAGQLALKVPPLSRTLAVALVPERAENLPGAETHLDVVVRDAAGSPVANAEVAVWMVDESVLALSGYNLPDPLSVFYATRGAGVRDAHSRTMVVLGDPLTLPEADSDAGARMEAPAGGLMRKDAAPARMMRSAGSAPPPAPSAGAPMAEGAMMMADAMGDAEEAAPEEPTDGATQLRTDFRATALFAPRVRTDATGAARVALTLPDSLTRYRAFAVAADAGTSFGSAEVTVVARKPLMLRPSPPRFLNVGDRAELPLVVQNPSDRDIVVDLALRLDNGRVLDSVDVDLKQAADRSSGGLRFTVPAEDRREVRLPVGVLDAGTLRWQAVIVGGGTSDAASDELPIWTPATTEAFATYGSLSRDGAAAKLATAVPIEAPTDAWPQYGGLEVSLSSTELHSLTDGILYLNSYPFECTEQVASRVLANAAMRDVLDAFESPQLPPADELRKRVADDLDMLVRRQLPNGGFLYWSGQLQLPYASLHAVHAMVRARDKGWPPDAQALRRGLGFAKTIERHIPGWYSERAKLTIRAYAVHILHLAGEADSRQARRLFDVGTSQLPLEAQGWILPTLAASGQTDAVDALVRHWQNNATETAAAASFIESYTDSNDYVLMHGARRTDAVLLEALLIVRPDDDLILKVVRGLLGHRVAGRWSTTQENGFVLLALDRYFRVYEGTTPNFVARAWIDGGLVADATFKGRETRREHLTVPMAWLVDKDRRDLVLAAEGEGRLYYRLGLRYAPSDLMLPPAEHGFSIERAYEHVDDPDDVTRDDDGTWVIRAGARVRVRVTTVVPARRTLVALMDPLPAGLEPLNPALAVSPSAPPDPSAGDAEPYWWWRRPWYSHQNLRDERAEAFADLVWPGVHTYTYTATATTPGRFIVPAPRIEEMYHPETFGRGATDRVVVR